MIWYKKAGRINKAILCKASDDLEPSDAGSDF